MRKVTILRHKRKLYRIKTDVLKVYASEFLIRMYASPLSYAKLIPLHTEDGETFGEDAMFVYLVRNYPGRNRAKYVPFRENISYARLSTAFLCITLDKYKGNTQFLKSGEVNFQKSERL